jgi:hypothetical protein
MGIRDWFTRERKREDDAAIARAEEEASGDSRSERETWSGDMEGLATDNRAAGRFGIGSPGGTDRLAE